VILVIYSILKYDGQLTALFCKIKLKISCWIGASILSIPA